ncbi:MAG TPA: RluA family pseudouridine synthase [Thermoanaerobaculia bacterium]
MNILYEDDDLLFLDKPPNIVVQRGYDAVEPVLFEEVQNYVEGKAERAFLMQRLDRGTSGVIFFTKRSEINAKVTRQFERKEIRKVYLALVEGRLDVQQTIDAPLARIGAIKFGVRSHGKRAITTLEPIEASDRTSLLRIVLHTGRTHQIRAHLAGIGHPLVGDWLYGERNAVRPMLHAVEIAMRHPQTSEMLVVTAELPDDFRDEMTHRRDALDSKQVT